MHRSHRRRSAGVVCIGNNSLPLEPCPIPTRPTPPAFSRSRPLVEGVAEGSFGSVPVGIRVSMSAGECCDEGPHNVDQLGVDLDLKPRWRAMPTSRSCQPCLSHPRLRHQSTGCCCSGGGERYGLSVGLVLPLGVVAVLTLQALPIRAGLRGGSRDDGLGRQDEPIWLMLCGYKKNETTFELK